MSDASFPGQPWLCLVTGTSAVGPVPGLAAALTVAFARSSDRGALLVECVDSTRRRQPTLLASAASRRIEARLRNAGLDAAARGHICSAALVESDRERMLSLLEAAGEGVQVVCHLGAVAAGGWLELGSPPVGGLLLAAELPREASLAALVHDSLRRRGIVARVHSGGIGPVASRRSLAGVPPGGGSEARISRFADALKGGLAVADQQVASNRPPRQVIGELDSDAR